MPLGSLLRFASRPLALLLFGPSVAEEQDDYTLASRAAHSGCNWGHSDIGWDIIRCISSPNNIKMIAQPHSTPDVMMALAKIYPAILTSFPTPDQNNWFAPSPCQRSLLVLIAPSSSRPSGSFRDVFVEAAAIHIVHSSV